MSLKSPAIELGSTINLGGRYSFRVDSFEYIETKTSFSRRYRGQIFKDESYYKYASVAEYVLLHAIYGNKKGRTLSSPAL